MYNDKIDIVIININNNNMEQLLTAITQEDLIVMDSILKDQNFDRNIVLPNSDTLLMIGIDTGNIDVVQKLLDYGVPMDIQNDDGMTALMMASNYGQFHLVELLIRYGANLNLKNKKNYTALHYACINEFYDIIKILVDHHIDLDTKDFNGNTALLHSVEANDVNSTKILLQAGAQILPNDGGWSPIDVADLRGRDYITELLKNYDFEIETKEPDGE